MERGTGGCDLHLSDVIEVIQNTDPTFNKLSEDGNTNTSKMPPPYVEIVEQPASKAMRFRYECEGRSAGSIPGQNSTPENKTFPTIRVVGYEGKAVVVVSCVTKDQPYKPHPHNLVGKEGCKKGVCTIEIPVETMTVTFPNLGIRCVKKRDIEEALRVREDIRVDPFRTGFAHRSQASSIDLNAVRLCFQVFLNRDGKFQMPLQPIVSEPIFDKKAMSDLAIFQLSSDCSSVAGGQKILLFCEKVTKDDINVRFFEEKKGQTVWEGFADFQPSDVHRQVGIAFTTPKYQTLEITEPVKTFIQLYRPSDKATSEPLPFIYTPLESEAEMKRKRPQRSGCDTPNNYYRAEKLQNTAKAAKNTLPSYGLMNNPGPSIKVEPRETPQFKMYGGSLSPASPAAIEAMHNTYRNTYSVPPGQSISPSVDQTNDMVFYNNPYQSPQVLNTMLSPRGESTPSNSNDGYNMANAELIQWNIPIKNDFSHKILTEFNSCDPQPQQLEQKYLIPEGANWVEYGPNTHNPNDVAMNNDAPTEIFDLDSQELRQNGVDYNFPQLNSSDIANNLHMFENQLSENLSNNLNIIDNNPNNTNRADEVNGGSDNMTDSGFTRLATSTLNDICNLNEILKDNN